MSTGEKKQMKLEFWNIDKDNVEDLRDMNAALFPVKYSNKFYNNLFLQGNFTQLAYKGNKLVGSICCRLADMEPTDEQIENELPVQKHVYIMTLGTKAAYRNRGIGSQLLQRILDECERDEDVAYVWLHVQTSNEDALRFYSRFGFEITETIEKYYKRIQPSSAHVLTKWIRRKPEEGEEKEIEEISITSENK